MASQRRNLFINGEWVNAADGAEFPVFNPSTSAVWTTVADASRADARAAIAAAQGAFPAWSRMSHAARTRTVAPSHHRTIAL